jgi:hypothetical protein
MSKVVNIRKKELQKRGYDDFEDWNNESHTLYIGRNMNFYVLGTDASKWQNPYTIKKYGLEKSLKLYKKHVKKNLMDSLSELKGKELGCWCKPNKCHGDILLELLYDL